MDKIPAEKMESLLKAISEYGGNVSVAHDSYLGEARTLRTYPRGTRAVTPDGEQELVVGVDVEVAKKLNRSLKMYGIRKEQTQEERERLFREANQSAVPEIVPFYLTPDGKIYYKCGCGGEFVVSYMEVPKYQIPEAERLLRNVKVVGYKDTPFITKLIGGDGSTVSSGTMLIGVVGDLRLLGEPQPEYSAESITITIRDRQDNRK